MAQTTTTTMIHVKDDTHIEINISVYSNLAVDFGANVTVFLTPDAAEDLMHQLRVALKDELPLAVQ